MPYKDPEKRKAAAKAGSRKHYEQHAAKIKERAAEFKIQQREVIRLAIWEYLQANPCIDCGETDPLVLEFDHRDTATKLYNISALVSRAYSVDTVMAEIAKCDVRCANCHRRRTAIQFGWYKNFMI